MRTLSLLLLSTLVALPAACGHPAAQGRTLVLISLDTCRPDHLGLYGGRPGTSPRLDALARQSVAFDQALASAPWTLPSHMTMLTGLDPFAHGVLNQSYRLADGVTTLAESLRQAGYDTAAFTDGGYVSAFYGFDQGFEVFDDQRDPDGPNGFPRIIPKALDWLDGRDRDDDVFLFLHTFDPHSPYDEEAPEILERFRGRPVEEDPRDCGLFRLSFLHQQVQAGVTAYHRMGDLLNDYDAGVFEADQGVGAVIDALQADGRWDDALLIVTSDHGEEFYDRRLHVGHGLSLTDDELHVPLLLRLPRDEAGGTRSDALVGVIDLPRTVLEVAGVQPDPVTQGESLLGLVRGQPRRLDYLVCASQNTRTWGLVKGGYTYVTPTGMAPMEIAKRHLGPVSPPTGTSDEHDQAYLMGPPGDQVELVYDTVGDPLGMRDVIPGGPQLYDRAADPEQRTNLAEQEPDLAQRMADFLTAQVEHSQGLGLTAHSTRNAPGEDGMDTTQRRTLAALGYVGGGTDDEDLDQLGDHMRRWLREPHVAPDMEPVIAVDRAVHRVRLRLLDGQPLRHQDVASLQAAGEAYGHWLGDHPEAAARILWRLQALLTLATTGGAQLDVAAWKAELQR